MQLPGCRAVAVCSGSSSSGAVLRVALRGQLHGQRGVRVQAEVLVQQQALRAHALAGVGERRVGGVGVKGGVWVQAELLVQQQAMRARAAMRAHALAGVWGGRVGGLG